MKIKYLSTRMLSILLFAQIFGFSPITQAYELTPFTPTVTSSPVQSPNASKGEEAKQVLGISTGSSWYVSTAGKSSGNGSKESPWDFKYALLGAGGKIRGGDTVYFRQGVYGDGTSDIDVRLSGIEGSPVLVRPYPGEHATISGTLMVRGGNVWYWGFEFTNKRTNDCIDTYENSDNVKFINNVIHDCGSNGVGFWRFSHNSEMYGNLIFYNGYVEGTRGHGHGIYTQNESGIKTIEDNIIFKGMALGIQAYGSGQAQVKGYRFLGNTIFQTGSIWANDNKVDTMLITNPNKAQDIIVDSTYTYHEPKSSDGYTRFGYPWTPREGEITIKNSYIIGGEMALYFRNWDKAVFQNNTLYATGKGAFTLFFEHLQDQQLSGYSWDNNKYYGSNLFRYNTTNTDFKGFVSKTGMDKNSQYLGETPTGQWVFVRPNKYERGRANVTIYNWNQSDSVSVDLSGSGLKTGEAFEIRDSQNFYGTPIYTGVYSGQPVNIPVTPGPVAKPYPGYRVEPVHTGREFNAFVVIPKSTEFIIPSVPVVSPSVAYAPEGFVDGVKSDGTVFGWALDKDSLGDKVEVHFYVDKNAGTPGASPIAAIKAQDYRGDVGNHAYNYTLPEEYKDGKQHRIWVWALDLTDPSKNTQLAGSPKLFTLPSPSPVTPQTTPPATPPSNQTIFEQYIEAENALFSGNMKVYTDTKASGGKYLSSPVGDSGSVDFNINIPQAGNYYVWARVEARTPSSDSFYVSDPKGTSDIFDVAEGKWSENWQWALLNGRNNTSQPLTHNPRMLALSAGMQKISFSAREVNTKLDKIYITNKSNGLPVDSNIGQIPEPNPTPPVATSVLPNISNVQVIQSAPGSAVITWQTDQPADGRVDYGKVPEMNLTASESGLYTLTHAVNLSGLTPGTKYYYVVKSKNSNGQESVLNSLSFTAIQPEPSSSLSTVRINSGLRQFDFTDNTGNIWQTDRYFSLGGGLYSSNAPEKNFDLLATAREGLYTNFSYSIPVVPGKYKVNLGFIELWRNAAGQRKFNVKLNNALVASNLDVFSESGGTGKELIKSFSVEASNGKINIGFERVVGAPMVSFIEVLPQ